jgi:protein translocase SecG subunit
MLTFGFYTCLTLFIIVCLFLILLILIQKGRGGGLASAFGGAGGNTAFGSKTGDVLTWATSIVFGIFIVLAVVLNIVAEKPTRARPRGRHERRTAGRLRASCRFVAALIGSIHHETPA